MSKTKDHFWDVQALEALEMDAFLLNPPMSPQAQWIRDTYPDIEEDSTAWEAATQAYDVQLAWEEGVIGQMWFEASLNNIQDRYDHACAELDELQALLDSPQANIVMRLAYVHCVTVMEAFLLYAARALLNHRPHLERFHAKKGEFLRKGPVIKALDTAYEAEKNGNEPALYRYRDVPGQAALACSEATCASLGHYKGKAQAVVGSLAFQSTGFIERYFSALLTTRPAWSFTPLKPLVDTRNDLVHRNGVTKDNRPVHINSGNLSEALATVRHFIHEAAVSLREESALSGGVEENEHGF